MHLSSKKLYAIEWELEKNGENYQKLQKKKLCPRQPFWQKRYPAKIEKFIKNHCISHTIQEQNIYDYIIRCSMRARSKQFVINK